MEDELKQVCVYTLKVLHPNKKNKAWLNYRLKHNAPFSHVNALSGCVRNNTQRKELIIKQAHNSNKLSLVFLENFIIICFIILDNLIQLK